MGNPPNRLAGSYALGDLRAVIGGSLVGPVLVGGHGQRHRTDDGTRDIRRPEPDLVEPAGVDQNTELTLDIEGADWPAAAMWGGSEPDLRDGLTTGVARCAHYNIAGNHPRRPRGPASCRRRCSQSAHKRSRTERHRPAPSGRLTSQMPCSAGPVTTRQIQPSPDRNDWGSRGPGFKSRQPDSMRWAWPGRELTEGSHVRPGPRGPGLSAPPAAAGRSQLRSTPRNAPSRVAGVQLRPRQPAWTRNDSA